MRQVLFCLVYFFITSCDKTPLSWSPGGQLDLIIEGGICTLDSVQFIKLSRPNFFYDDNLDDLDNAIVKVSNGTDVFDFKPTSDKGMYSAIVHAKADGPKAYHLTVRINDNLYQATDSLYRIYGERYTVIDKFIVKGSTVEISYSKHNFGKRLGWSFLLQRAPFTWEPFPKVGSNNYSYSYPFGTPNALGKILSPTISHVFNTTDSVDFYFFSMSPAYSKFMYGVFRETDWKGLLSSVSGNVKGNISGNAGGFFYVMDAVKKRKSLTESFFL